MSQRVISRVAQALATAAIVVCCAACHSPKHSQRFFATAAQDDPMLELLHETALYSVYFDHALRRCVLHSAYTWGENGGGGGGAGIGVALFPCDPARLKTRSGELREAIEGGRELLLPTATPPAAAAAAPAQDTAAAPPKAPLGDGR